MRKIAVFLSALLMLMALSGCNIQQKLGERIVEGILEKSGSDVDIDGDTVTVVGEDGEQLTLGGTEWPDSDLAKLIPKCNKGTVTYVMESEGSLYIMVEDVDSDDAREYVNSIKDDFQINPYDMSYEGGFSYTAENEDGAYVSVSYSDSDIVIMISKDA